jgi:hypothetical protein
LIDNDIPFDNSPLLPRSQIDGNGIFVRVAGVVPILTIFFFVIDSLVVDRHWHSF